MTDIKLPKLPEPDICRYVVTVWRDGVECEIDKGPRYTVEQMQAYAREAVRLNAAPSKAAQVHTFKEWFGGAQTPRPYCSICGKTRAEHAAPEAPAAPQPARTALEQYDLEQSEGYRKGYNDGRVRGYGVGYRQATEHAAMNAQPAQQPLTDDEVMAAFDDEADDDDAAPFVFLAGVRFAERKHLGVKND